MLILMRSRSERVFVYGTLRRGQALHGLMKEAGFQYRGTGTIRARLYDLGEYPGAVPSGSNDDVVRGEIYLATEPERQISRIDEEEDFDSRRPARSLFLRRHATVRLSNGRRVRAWVYFLPREPAEARRIDSGNYASRNRTRRTA
jgi:gamma-glutamylcyclotransferase (GGCT)/AIG2-like uncharacterized protein YtfP